MSWSDRALAALALVLLGAVVGVTANACSRSPLPLVGRVTSAAGALSVRQARDLFAAGRATFVDVRTARQYARAHIPGALSLPWHEAEGSRLTSLPRGCVLYCDGPRCGAAESVGRRLPSARVLSAGLDGWLAAGLPVTAQP